METYVAIQAFNGFMLIVEGYSKSVETVVNDPTTGIPMLFGSLKSANDWINA